MNPFYALPLMFAIVSPSLRADDSELPPYQGELQFLERKQRSRLLNFFSRNGDSFQIQEMRLGGPMQSEFVKLRESFGDGQFLLSEVEEKEGISPQGEVMDMTELTIHDNGNGRSFTLIYREPYNWPDYYAELRWSKDENSPIFYVKEGHQFEIMEDKGLSYELLRVKEDELVLRIVGGNGEALLLKREKKGS